MEHRIERSIQRSNTPIQVSTVPRRGELRKYSDRWEITIDSSHLHSGSDERFYTIDANDDGPTEKQLELACQFPQRYSEIKTLIREKLRQFLAEIGAPEELENVDFGNLSVYVLSPEDEADIEIWYETTNEHSAMGYAVSLSDWQVRDVYGAD